MSSASGSHCPTSRKNLRVLLPFSCRGLRIPDELADNVGAGEALVVGPFAKVWPVKVARDGDGAFMGRGWSEYAAACGVGAGWLVILRHRGRGVLTAKAFDASCSIRELGTPFPHPVEASMSTKDAPLKPQFICVLPPDSMKKMPIPPEFVQRYMPKENLDNAVAVILGPLGKVFHIKLEMNQSDVLFADRWPQFLKFHSITKDNVLLLRYEGSMTFTVKVFEPNGCQRECSKQKDIRMQQTVPGIEKQQEAPFASILRCKSESNWTSTVGHNESNSSVASMIEASLQRNIYDIGPPPCITKSSNTNAVKKPLQVCTIEKKQEAPSASSQKCKSKTDKSSSEEQKASSKTRCAYMTGPPAWIKKDINTNTIKRYLALPMVFCEAIGLPDQPCMIMLKTTLSSSHSWQVRVLPYKNTSYQRGLGWKSFCRENNLKEGDVCTFNMVEIRLWHVIIERRQALT